MSLETDESGRLLRKTLMARGGTQPILDSMNHFYAHRLPQILSAYHIEIPGNRYCKFINPVFVRPDINDIHNQGQPRKLWPAEARLKQHSYMAKVSATLQMYERNPQKGPVPVDSIQVYLGKIPVMVGSELCHTYNLTEDQLYSKGEPKKDCKGYMIIRGTEKVFLNIERLRTKLPLLYEDKEKFTVRYTSETITDTSLVIIREQAPYSVNIAFDKIGSKGPGVNVLWICRLFGLTHEEALNMMETFIVDGDPLRERRRRREFREYMRSTINSYLEKTGAIIDRILDVLVGEYDDNKIRNSANRKIEVLKSIWMDLFKNIYINEVVVEYALSKPDPLGHLDQSTRTSLIAKARMICYMVTKYVEFKTGYRVSDNRDFWGNKRLDDAAKHMAVRFHQIWRSMVNDIRNKIQNNAHQTVAQIKTAVIPNPMETQFISYFTKEGLGIGPHGKKDVVKVDILKRDNLLASFAHIRRINTPTSRRARIRSKRLINPTQWGVVCNIATPEGENCLEVSTPILMADGSMKPIGELKDGDEVMTVDIVYHKQTPSKIHSHFVRDAQETLKVKTDFGEIVCTPDHMFLTDDEDWVEAKDLVTWEEGEGHGVLLVSTMCFERVRSVEANGPCKVADFTTLSENHSMISGGFVTHNCGLVKEAALTTYVSLYRSESIIRKKLDSRYSPLPTEGRRNPIFLNGVCLGYGNARELHTYLLSLRRTKEQIPFDTGILLNQYNELFVFTDDGRVCRPLLIVDPDTQTLIIDKDPNLRRASFQTLLDVGAIEYIDTTEQEQTSILIATSGNDLRYEINRLNDTIREHQRILDPRSESSPEQRRSAEEALLKIQQLQKYTHCETDPTSIMGISASIIPFPEFNPAPRLTYQSAMGKQALGPNASRVEFRYDTTTRAIVYPGVPSVATDAHEWLGMDEFPGGHEAIVAITTYGGGNQEDAIIMNKGAIDRGFFMMMIYHSYTEKICPQRQNIREEIRVPDYSPDKAARYAKLDPATGIVRLNEFVSEGDCLIGKVTTDRLSGKKIDTSLFVDVNKSGRVDGIFITEGVDSCKLIRIRIRELRKPQVGDKFASRYSQKGTIGELLPEADMPEVISELPELKGVRPHILFNPHGIPSRMTIGKLMEMMAGFYASITGTRINATAFRRFDIRKFQQMLHELGFSRKGTVRMRNNRTGREMDADIYFGSVYYQLLRHMVQEKMQARATGEVQILTRQPVPGIRRIGGLRLGEMERDTLIQHGAAYLLQERMSISSDVWQGIFCQECGRFAIHKIEQGEFICGRKCPRASFFRAQVPYAAKLLAHLLLALNIEMRFRPKES